MLARVTMTIDGAEHVLRLSTRAMVRLEEREGKPIHEILAGLGGSVDVRFIMRFIGAAMNDGVGGTDDEAADLIDAAGGPFAAVDLLNRTIEAAFPEQAKAAQSGNADAAETPPKRKARG